jgi:hypothetical protein
VVGGTISREMDGSSASTPTDAGFFKRLALPWELTGKIITNGVRSIELALQQDGTMGRKFCKVWSQAKTSNEVCVRIVGVYSLKVILEFNERRRPISEFCDQANGFCTLINSQEHASRVGYIAI